MRNKQTKIIATIADATCTKTFLKELHDNGVDCIRLNTAHCTPEHTRNVIRQAREVSQKLAVLIDTKGPEIRTTHGTAHLKDGQEIALAYGTTHTTNTAIHVTYKDIASLEPNARILIDDGSIELNVKQKKRDHLICTVRSGGTLTSRKGVNLPGLRVDLPALTKKDKEFIELAKQEDADFIAHSFVRNTDDIKALKRAIGKHPIKIIAKIENQEGANNIESILPEVYGIMVARGDLGIEIGEERVPAAQKKIIHTCIKHAKPVITATQMLQSMIEHPRATRAEISDVANAIYDGSDAVMLSAETAVGKHPLKAVQTMTKIAKATEKEKKLFRQNKHLLCDNAVQGFLTRNAVFCASELPIRAIVCATSTGTTARLCASFRGKIPIYARTNDVRTMREMAIIYGVYPDIINHVDTTDELLKAMLSGLDVKDDDLIAIVGSNPKDKQGADFLEITTLRSCKMHLSI